MNNKLEGYENSQGYNPDEISECLSAGLKNLFTIGALSKDSDCVSVCCVGEYQCFDSQEGAIYHREGWSVSTKGKTVKTLGTLNYIMENIEKNIDKYSCDEEPVSPEIHELCETLKSMDLETVVAIYYVGGKLAFYTSGDYFNVFGAVSILFDEVTNMQPLVRNCDHYGYRENADEGGLGEEYLGELGSADTNYGNNDKDSYLSDSYSDLFSNEVGDGIIGESMDLFDYKDEGNSGGNSEENDEGDNEDAEDS